MGTFSRSLSLPSLYRATRSQRAHQQDRIVELTRETFSKILPWEPACSRSGNADRSEPEPTCYAAAQCGGSCRVLYKKWVIVLTRTKKMSTSTAVPDNVARSIAEKTRKMLAKICKLYQIISNYIKLYQIITNPVSLQRNYHKEAYREIAQN